MNRVTLLLSVIVATACQTSEKPAPPPPPPPTEALVTAMRDYCKIASMPDAKQREAAKLWGWQTAGNKDVGPIWTAAVVKKSPPAIAMIRAAADAAVGPGNCQGLAALGPPEAKP